MSLKSSFGKTKQLKKQNIVWGITFTYSSCFLINPSDLLIFNLFVVIHFTCQRAFDSNRGTLLKSPKLLTVVTLSSNELQIW